MPGSHLSALEDGVLINPFAAPGLPSLLRFQLSLCADELESHFRMSAPDHPEVFGCFPGQIDDRFRARIHAVIDLNGYGLLVLEIRHLYGTAQWILFVGGGQGILIVLLPPQRHSFSVHAVRIVHGGAGLGVRILGLSPSRTHQTQAS